jgi:hypothetical protein
MFHALFMVSSSGLSWNFPSGEKWRLGRSFSRSERIGDVPAPIASSKQTFFGRVEEIGLGEAVLVGIMGKLLATALMRAVWRCDCEI